MAEAVGLAATLLSIADLSKKTLNSIHISSAGLISIDILEYKTYCEVLDQVGGKSLSIFGELSDVVQTGLTLCRERATQMEIILSSPAKDIVRFKKDGLRQQEAKIAIEDFDKSVKMLRDIVMDATTHTLLQEQHHHVSEILGQVFAQINDLRMHFHPSDRSCHPADRQPQEGLNYVAEQLQVNVEHSMSRNTSWRQESHGLFSFDAAIIHPHSHDSGRTFVHAKIDSGCEDNWIALETLKRASMESQVNELEVRVSYVLSGAQTFEPLEMIDVTWYPTKSGKSWRTRFFVHREVPFDVVLGQRWILEEGWSYFEQPAMGLRMGKFSKEEHRMMEENARKKRATKSQISEVRRANDATARDRLRQEKAASLVASPAFSSSHKQPMVPLSVSQLYSPS